MISLISDKINCKIKSFGKKFKDTNKLINLINEIKFLT